MNDLKNELYDTLYWYFRKEYAKIVDMVEEENSIKVSITKSAELYANEKIKEIIKIFSQSKISQSKKEKYTLL